MEGVLQFDAEQHIYTVNGIVRPSVTQVLEDVGIIDYSQVPDGVRIRALERGRIVHTLTQYDDEGTLDPDTIDPAVSGFLDGWRRFRHEMKFVPTLIEEKGYNERYEYCGTLDRIGSFIGGKFGDVLVDIKTNYAPYWAAIQTSAYANFYPSPMKFRRMAVSVFDDGTYKIHEFKCSDFTRHLNQFLAALTVYNTKRGNLR